MSGKKRMNEESTKGSFPSYTSTIYEKMRKILRRGNQNG